MRDVSNGWMIRYLHSNTASAFFFLVYLHMARGIYYGSYRSPRVLTWTIGVIIFILMVAIGFLGYVLPYGQMSLWGATVITNLISAIPWIGQDIVESTKYITVLSISFFILCSVLPTIGTVHKNALKVFNKTLDKKYYLSTPSSFLGFLVGLIDGDGYIQITKTTKGFITMKLVISLQLEDISTLEYINSTLKLGNINVYKDLKSPSCRLVINRTELQEILFPLLIYNNIFFLTETRVNQFNLAMHILKNDIKLFDEIPTEDNIENVFQLPSSPYDYTLLYFFKNWIVGFACSEGSFFIKSNNDGCFQLKQRIHTNLFEAFKLVFNTKRKIDTTNNYNQFGVSSKADIQTVINFFSFEGLHPLIGLKYIQYLKWLNNLQNSMRYNKLNYPKL